MNKPSPATPHQALKPIGQEDIHSFDEDVQFIKDVL